MSSPEVSAAAVIATKLRVPSPRPEQVPRPRLLGMLEEGLDCKVALVSAPAGYGKTILLSQWLRSREADGVFAFVSLDEQDDDPIRLWRHIVESLGRGARVEEFGAAILAALSVAGAEVSGTVLPMLVNTLGEVPQGVLLVLDDYQFAAGEGCHEAMDFFVEHLPENVHLVLATHSDPPLQLGRLRAMGELNEIRTEHLAFTEQEVPLCSTRGWACTSVPRTSRCCWTAPRVGPLGSTSPCSRWKEKTTCTPRSLRSGAATVTSSISWEKRFWPVSPRTRGGSCSRPRCSAR